MNRNQLLARARSQISQGVRYKLGKGGMNPAASSPVNLERQCDCSGFVARCLGISRMTTHPLYVKFNGGWINTDAVVHDANEVTGFFERLAAPEPGAMIVFPSPGANKVGHIGIVSAVVQGAVTKVIHCSAGNDRAFGDAIQETDAAVFNKPLTIFAWYAGVER